jgi:hypothetical protein
MPPAFASPTRLALIATEIHPSFVQEPMMGKGMLNGPEVQVSAKLT